MFFKVIDNVVSKKYQDGLEATFYGKNFQWKCNSNLAGGNEGYQFGLTHQLIDRFEYTSNCTDYVTPLSYEISEKSGVDFEKIYNIRTFLQVPMGSKKEHDIFHVDVVFPHYVFLYYVNDSDGDTIILNKRYVQDGNDFLQEGDYSEFVLEKVSPKKGRVVVFDGFLFHTAGIPKNNPRCVINYNVIQKS